MTEDEAKLNSELQAAHKRAAAAAIAAAIAVLHGTITEDDIDNAIHDAGVAYRAAIRPTAEHLTVRLDRIYREGKAAGTRQAERLLHTRLETSFTLVDRNAIRAMASHRIYWIGNHFETAISARIKAVAQHEIIEGGLGAKEAAEAMRVALEREFGLLEGGPPRPVPVPTTWKGTSKDYYTIVAGNTATAARVAGGLRAYADAGIERVVWETAGDERVCGRCEPMDGKEFLVSSQIKLLDRLVAAETPEEAKEIAPWLSGAAFKKHLDDTPEDLAEAGLSLPPVHARCRCLLSPVM